MGNRRFPTCSYSRQEGERLDLGDWPVRLSPIRSANDEVLFRLYARALAQEKSATGELETSIYTLARSMAMPRVKLNIQRLMVAIIFLAIAFWAGPDVAPEFVRRWRTCSDRASRYESMARTEYVRAATSSARSQPDGGAICLRRADGYSRQARRYRCSLLVPWQAWSLGDY